jgi:hypothetical protein
MDKVERTRFRCSLKLATWCACVQKRGSSPLSLGVSGQRNFGLAALSHCIYTS